MKHPSRLGRDPVVLGVVYCLLAAVGYSVVNGLLRMLTVECDRVWVLFVKESVTVAGVVPWLVYQWWRRRLALPSRRVVGVLALAGLITQLIGNLPCMWAFSVIGLTVALPLMSGVSLTASAISGRVFLGEAVSVRSMIAIALVILSVILLSMGAESTNQAIAATADVPSGPIWVAMAVVGAVVAGMTYCGLSVTIRHSVTGTVSPWVVVLIVPLMGTLCYTPLGYWGSGLSGLTSVSGWQLAAMLAAGVLNLGAFVAFTKGLQWTPVATANVLEASQVALGAVTGILLFHEPPGPWLTLGIVLTIAGMILIGRSASAGPATPETPL